MRRESGRQWQDDIVDFGQNAINQARVVEGHLPFEWPPKTGILWKVTRRGRGEAQGDQREAPGGAANNRDIDFRNSSMTDKNQDSRATQELAKMVGLGTLAGVAGSVVMTAFQKLIEMPISGREDSYQPARLAQKLLPIDPPDDDKARKRLNYAMHFTLGAMWGAAYGVAAYKGLRGSRAVLRVFPTIYTNDVAVSTVLGLGKPWKWSRKEFTIDVVDKFVQVAATSFIFDRILDPKRRA